MNILIVNRALGTLFGGGESFDLNAARYFRRKGHQVTLVTGKPLWGTPKNKFVDIDVNYVSCPELRKYAYATEVISRKLSAGFYHLDNLAFERAVFSWYNRQPKNSYDIVQCCSLFNLPAWLLRRHRQPIVSWLPGPPSGLTRRSLETLSTKHGFGLFAHGETVRHLNTLGLLEGRDFEVIEPGIDLVAVDATQVDRLALRRQLGLSEQDLVGITTARLVPVKRLDFLIEGIAQAKAHGVKWHWLVVGKGPEERALRALATSLGLGGQVRFLGYKPQEEVHRWLEVADLFALTSRYESFSIATLEAMAHSLPVVGVRAGYLPQLICDARAGILVDNKGTDDLAQALADMQNSATRTQYGRNGRAFVEQLDWPHIVEKLERLYLKVQKS